VDESAARQLLLHYLEELAGGNWVQEEAFCQALRTANPDFLREDHTALAWAVVDVATGVEIYGPTSWEAVEGRWARHVLRGPLHWLGVVRRGVSADGRGVVLQLGPGARLGHRDSEAEELPRAGLSLMPARAGFDLAAPSTADLGALYRLEPYLELKHRGSVSLYRLSKESVLDQLARGGALEELRDLLRSISTEPLPSEVFSRLEDWAACYGRLSVETAVLLMAQTQEAAETVEKLPGAGRCLEGRLGPGSYRVVPDRVWELVQSLRAAGQFPRVDPGVRARAVRLAATDLALLRECLMALLVLRSLPVDPPPQGALEAIARLEAALGPEESAAVGRQAEGLSKRLRRR
jgi:hypothetical protein